MHGCHTGSMLLCKPMIVFFWNYRPRSGVRSLLSEDNLWLILRLLTAYSHMHSSYTLCLLAVLTVTPLLNAGVFYCVSTHLHAAVYLPSQPLAARPVSPSGAGRLGWRVRKVGAYSSLRPLSHLRLLLWASVN